jgi:hypothetical protein
MMTTPEPLTVLPADLTPVRICLLSCGHFQWMPQPDHMEGVWFCLCCNEEVELRHYIDEMAVNA